MNHYKNRLHYVNILLTVIIETQITTSTHLFLLFDVVNENIGAYTREINNSPVEVVQMVFFPFTKGRSVFDCTTK